ncbi:MAG: putative immunity protein [Rectinema sp.]
MEAKKTKTLWKSMRAGLTSGSGNIGPWKIGEWRTHKGHLSMCSAGFHASERAIDAMTFVPCEILAVVEVKGKRLTQRDKQCWQEMRVVRAYEWTKSDSVTLAIYAAERCIGNYEKKYPRDNRPRLAIKAAAAWLKNPTEANMSAARSAAESAARSAAESAAWSAESAARSAAWSAALDEIEVWLQARIKTLKQVTP